MPPRLPLPPAKAAKDGASLLARSAASESQAICFFCSLSRPAARPAAAASSPRHPRRKPLSSTSARRFQSTATAAAVAPQTQTSTATAATSDPRKELEQVLLDLQKHAANYVNLSRLQLALNGLRQQPGHESVRVAILGLANGSEASKTAKTLLKLLLADPLKTEEEWEQEIDRHNLAQPMIIRVGAEERQELGTMTVNRGSLLHEVNVSSVALNGHKLELLLMETNPYATVQGEEGLGAFEDAVLVPTYTRPSWSPMASWGAGSVTTLPLLESESIIAAAVNLPDYKPADAAALPFTVVDVGTAGAGLRLIRKDVGNAMEYEHKWYESNVPKLVEWLKQDVISTPESNATKAPVRRLIASLLQNASASIQREEVKQLSSRLSSSASSSSSTAASTRTTAHLQRGLSDWAETAHAELQEQLDLAFSSGRWRKLGWWKLFWRVDDVGMLTTDILSQRFLPGAEKNAIYLAGRIEEAGVPTTNFPVTYASPLSSTSSSPEVQQPKPTSLTHNTARAHVGPITRWPTSISTARSYLQQETIPALQALAQKLVLQTLSTSGLTTSMGALAYFGTLTTGLYEAGAVAALGIVWSLRRMQKQWEAARLYWEGEVREEGRKAVRGVEVSVAHVLDNDAAARGDSAAADITARQAEAELRRARELVDRATMALEKLK
ncbi:Pro-apoptotic serine protease [Apiospora arundinis]